MILELNSIVKSFPTHRLFDLLSLKVDSRALALVGSSGSGKSTLLRMVAGLETPDQGEIHLENQKLPYDDPIKLLAYRRSLGVVFQSWNLFSHLTAHENIILPLHRVHKVSLQEAQVTASDLLERFGLGSHKNKKPSELSGGQNQRVAILRAIAHKPSIILLDEPTSALDPIMTVEVLDLLLELKQQGTSFFLVSHHLPFLKVFADTIAFVHEGKILECAKSKDFFLKAKHPQVQSYLDTVLKYS